MPELPELEVARRNLQRWLRGATIVAVRAAKSLVLESSPAKVAAIADRRVLRVERRGKWLRWTLDDDTRVFSHFGMTGRWVKRTLDDPAERSERVRLDVRKSKRTYSLRYVDPRMFGRFVVAREDVSGWSALGPDPLVDGLDPHALHARFAKIRRTIKEVLMDQSVIAGVGNIQATDALYLARIAPSTPAQLLEPKDVRAIVRGIERSIERTLALEEGPEITYVEDPGAPNPFLVYGRGGDPCPRCGETLVRTVLGGRGTVHCPHCQPPRSASRERSPGTRAAKKKKAPRRA